MVVYFYFWYHGVVGAILLTLNYYHLALLVGTSSVSLFKLMCHPCLAYSTDLYIFRFPQQVELLQKLPLPSSLHKSTSSSLYDWISTHVSD